MRDKVAKALRRAVYGDLSPRDRKYYINRETGVIYADDTRRKFQASKRRYLEEKKQASMK